MTTFHQITLVCPHCKNRLSDFELMSYTVYNTTRYPDGKVDMNPWQNNDKSIALCPVCNKVFWRADAMVGTEELPDETLPPAGDLFDLPFAMQNDSKKQLINFYNNLLQTGFANTIDKKIYLRLRIWWKINDFKRYQQPLFIELLKAKTIKRAKIIWRNRKESNKQFANFKPLFEENLKKLISIYQPENKDDYEYMAEMYRQMENH